MDFYKLLLFLVWFLAHARAKESCSIDVGFLLDASSTVGVHSFKKNMVGFVKKVAEEYYFSKEDGVQAGVIQFGRKSRVETKLNRCQTRDCFLKEVNSLKYDKENRNQTRIDAALKDARTQLFQTSNGYRGGGPDHPAYIILITDGGQNPFDFPIDQSKVAAANEAGKLKEKGIKIIVLGLIEEHQQSWNLHEDLMSKEIASPGLYTRVGNLERLANFVQSVMKSTCYTCVDDLYEGAPIDVGFLIDSSGKADYFDRELEIVKGIVKTFKIKLGDNLAGLISYGSTGELNTIEIGALGTVEEFNQAVRNLKQEGGAKRQQLDKALADTYPLFERSRRKQGLDKVRRVLFVFSDGKLSEDETERAITEITNLKANLEPLIVFIAMGNDFPYLKLVAASGGPAQTVKPDNLANIIKGVCNAPAPCCACAANYKGTSKRQMQ